MELGHIWSFVTGLLQFIIHRNSKEEYVAVLQIKKPWLFFGMIVLYIFTQTSSNKQGLRWKQRPTYKGQRRAE